MKRILSISAILLLLAGKILAQEVVALPISRIDRNPVTSAWAGAGAASIETAAYGAFSNAAMLPFWSGTLDAALSFQYWMPGVSPSANVSVGATWKISPQVGLSLGYSLGNDLPYNVYDNPGSASGTFYPKNHVIAFGLGTGITEWLSLGVNVRYVRDIPAPEAVFSGVSADLFAAFQLNPGLRLSAGVSTLGTKVQGFRQPASAKIAVNWGTVFAETHAIDLLADADWYFTGTLSAAFGLRYAWNNTIFVRAGYRLAPDNSVIPAHLAVGLGVRLYGVRLDVSYLTASPLLGNTVNAGLAYSF